MAWTIFALCFCHLLDFSSSVVSRSVRLAVDRCGHVSYEEPAILGRNVTFTFIPSLYYENSTVLWQHSKNSKNWHTLSRIYKYTQFVQNGTYYLVVTDTNNDTGGGDAIFYQVQYLNDSVNCTMETSKLELKDLSEMDCGLVFLKTKKIEEGKKVEIGYYPRLYSQASNDGLTWVRIYNNQTVTLNISEDDVYVEEARANIEYVLTIFSFNSDMDGNYAVQCDTNLVSNGVNVILPVAPESLTLEGRRNIYNCSNCIVGSHGENVSVYCQINGGSDPTSVSMLIGNESLQNVVQYDKSGRYVVEFNLLNKHHGNLVRCLVDNDALDSPMSAKAHVYVIKPPSFRGMEMPSILKEGDSVDISCKFSEGRPAPTLSLKYDNVELSPVQQDNRLNATDQYYTSVLSLTTFSRSWNGQNISCCGYSEWYWNRTQCFSPQRVDYRFPPSGLGLELRKGNQTGEFNAVCTMYGSNPICGVKWRGPAGSIHSKRSFQNVSKPYGAWDAVFMASVKKTGRNAGEIITCESECPDFNVTMENSIFLPYAPVLEFNTSGEVLEITRGSRVHVSCIARSSPSSNISWIEDATSEKDEKDLKHCELDNDCVITIQGHTISQRNFSCSAENLVGNSTKTLIVYIIASPTKDNQDSVNKFGYLKWILIGASVAFVNGIAVVVILMWKRHTAKKEKSAPCNSREEAVRHNDGAEELPLGIIPDAQLEAAQPDTVYAVVEKGLKKSIPDDDTMYSVVTKSVKPESAKSTSKANKNAGSGELLYVDLAFDSPRPSQQAVVKRRESAVEYVGVDFLQQQM